MFTKKQLNGSPYPDEGRDDGVHCPVDDLEAVLVVLPQETGSHEGEDGHDVVQYTTLHGAGSHEHHLSIT